MKTTLLLICTIFIGLNLTAAHMIIPVSGAASSNGGWPALPETRHDSNADDVRSVQLRAGSELLG